MKKGLIKAQNVDQYTFFWSPEYFDREVLTTPLVLRGKVTRVYDDEHPDYEKCHLTSNCHIGKGTRFGSHVDIYFGSSSKLFIREFFDGGVGKTFSFSLKYKCHPQSVRVWYQSQDVWLRFDGQIVVEDSRVTISFDDEITVNSFLCVYVREKILKGDQDYFVFGEIPEVDQSGVFSTLKEFSDSHLYVYLNGKRVYPSRIVVIDNQHFTLSDYVPGDRVICDYLTKNNKHLSIFKTSEVNISNNLIEFDYSPLYVEIFDESGCLVLEKWLDSYRIQVELTKALVDSLCACFIPSTFSAQEKFIIQERTNIVTLKEEPILSSLIVTVSGVIVVDYSVNGRNLVFNENLEVYDVVTVDYVPCRKTPLRLEIFPSANGTDFELKERPIYFEVYIDGLCQEVGVGFDLIQEKVIRVKRSLSNETLQCVYSVESLEESLSTSIAPLKAIFHFEESEQGWQPGTNTTCMRSNERSYFGECSLKCIFTNSGVVFVELTNTVNLLNKSLSMKVFPECTDSLDFRFVLEDVSGKKRYLLRETAIGNTWSTFESGPLPLRMREDEQDFDITKVKKLYLEFYREGETIVFVDDISWEPVTYWDISEGKTYVYIPSVDKDFTDFYLNGSYLLSELNYTIEDGVLVLNKELGFNDKILLFSTGRFLPFSLNKKSVKKRDLGLCSLTSDLVQVFLNDRLLVPTKDYYISKRQIVFLVPVSDEDFVTVREISFYSESELVIEKFKIAENVTEDVYQLLMTLFPSDTLVEKHERYLEESKRESVLSNLFLALGDQVWKAGQYLRGCGLSLLTLRDEYLEDLFKDTHLPREGWMSFSEYRCVLSRLTEAFLKGSTLEGLKLAARAFTGLDPSFEEISMFYFTEEDVSEGYTIKTINDTEIAVGKDERPTCFSSFIFDPSDARINPIKDTILGKIFLAIFDVREAFNRIMIINCPRVFFDNIDYSNADLTEVKMFRSLVEEIISVVKPTFSKLYIEWRFLDL